MATILRRVNGEGIPCIESTAVELTTTAATFTFNAHPFVRNNFSGLILVKISNTFTAPGTPVPVQFTTAGVAGSTQPVLTFNGTEVTTADWEGEGVYLFFYDRENNQLILLT